MQCALILHNMLVFLAPTFDGQSAEYWDKCSGALCRLSSAGRCKGFLLEQAVVQPHRLPQLPGSESVQQTKCSPPCRQSSAGRASARDSCWSSGRTTSPTACIGCAQPARALFHLIRPPAHPVCALVLLTPPSSTRRPSRTSSRGSGTRLSPTATRR